jgi:tellurite methyltransferase
MCAEEPSEVQNPWSRSSERPSDWDVRHQAAAQSSPAEPASFVRELLPLLPRGPALDLACGSGRHSLLLAERRQAVTAADSSAVGLDILEERARASGLPVHRAEKLQPVIASRHGIELVEVDLERAVLPAASFALILCVQYLQRSLFGQIARALEPGGMILFETYTTAQLAFAGGPKNPEHLLEHGELRAAFPSLRLVFYRELRAGTGIASLIAQKPFGAHAAVE